VKETRGEIVPGLMDENEESENEQGKQDRSDVDTITSFA
jgi:hypothetical protein